MEKKLPKVYVNKINKIINNNEKIYKTKEKEEHKTEKQKDNQEQKFKLDKEKTLTQKINKIMNTKKYIYKIPVKIYLNDKEISTKIIGKNQKHIITIENELIKIEDIKDIEIEEN